MTTARPSDTRVGHEDARHAAADQLTVDDVRGAELGLELLEKGHSERLTRIDVRVVSYAPPTFFRIARSNRLRLAECPSFLQT